MTSDRNTLSDKELHYLKDFMSWELLAMKKCRETADACQDNQIKQLIEQTGKKHLEQYQAILNHLQ
jgi:ferritin-like metal-binding protein YciE